MKITLWRCTRGCAAGKTKYIEAEGGWALLETLVALPIVSLTVFAALLLLMASLAEYERLSAYADLQFYARTAADNIIKDVKQSQSIEILSSGGILRLTHSGGQQISYYLNQQQLIRYAGGSGIPVTENTTLIEFVRISVDAVQVRIITKKKSQAYSLSATCTGLT